MHRRSTNWSLPTGTSTSLGTSGRRGWPQKDQDRVPRVDSLAEGDGWVFPGYDVTLPFSWGATAGRNPADMGPWCRYEDINPGSFDPVARVKEMQEDGVDAELIFGSNNPRTFVAGHEDADLHHEMIRAYNDFMSEFCATAPDRLGGTALLPNRGIEGCLNEIEPLSPRCPVSWPSSCSATRAGSRASSPKTTRSGRPSRPRAMPLTIHVGLVEGKMGAGRRQSAKSLPGTGHFYDAPKRMLRVHLRGRARSFPEASASLSLRSTVGGSRTSRASATTTSCATARPRCATPN